MCLRVEVTVKVYVAIRAGVYRHDILGVFSTVEAASYIGQCAIIAESDHYHSVDVVELDLDGPAEGSGPTDTWSSPPEHPLFTLRFDHSTKLVSRSR